MKTGTTLTVVMADYEDIIRMRLICHEPEGLLVELPKRIEEWLVEIVEEESGGKVTKVFYHMLAAMCEVEV